MRKQLRQRSLPQRNKEAQLRFWFFKILRQGGNIDGNQGGGRLRCEREPNVACAQHLLGQGSYRIADLHPENCAPKLARSEEHTSELQSRGQLACRPPL